MTYGSYDTILFEKRDRIATVTLNRPDRLNAVSEEMTDELLEVFTEIEKDDEVWTIIVTGAGRALCSGADVAKVPEAGKEVGLFGVQTRGQPYLGTLWQWEAPQEATPPYRQMSKPIICAVNGICAGAGLDLVTTCDIAIASDKASFMDPHTSIGLVSGREAVRLARVIPMNIAMRMMLMGKHERLGAERAYQLGLISEVVPHDDLMARAWEIAETVNKNAPLAVRGTRLAIRNTMSLPVAEAELLAESYRLRVAMSQDAREGPIAFGEKRDPVWKVT
jgi:enoyl-CoA hydratase/carnithine racemase